MESIACNKPICLVRLIIRKIALMYDSTAYNDNIKYGVFLTKVCLRAGVDELDTDKKKMQRMPINRSSQTRVTGQYQN